MLKILILFFSLGSIVAAYLNIKKRKSCFVLWTVANIGQIGSILIFKATDFYGQIPLWACFCILNIYGWVLWRREERRRKMSTKEDLEPNEFNGSAEEWGLKITRESNGYVLKGRSVEGTPITFVIEDDDRDELKSHEDLLWEIMNYFAFGGSKHDKERLKITRETRKDEVNLYGVY
jgi:hypothetical protein